jgi:hypothetical protein
MKLPVKFPALLLALAVLLAACGKKTTPEADARHFFDLLNQGKTQEAYDSTAFVFQVGQTFKAFEAGARDAGFVGARDFVLKPRTEADGRPAFEGALSTPAGRPIAFDIRMAWEKGAWRVLSLRARAAGPNLLVEDRFSVVGRGADISPDINRELPSEAAIKALAQEAIQQFSSGLKQRDFEEFYDYIARHWQSQVSKVRLYRAFQPFIDQGIDLTDVVNMDPVYDTPPRIDSDGLLVVIGHFDTHPRKAFIMKFIYEMPRWRLFGINVMIVDDSSAKQATPAPSATPGTP